MFLRMMLFDVYLEDGVGRLGSQHSWHQREIAFLPF